MRLEEDVKIADFSQKKAKKPQIDHTEYHRESKSGNLEKADALGNKLATALIENIDRFAYAVDADNSEIMMQRGTLLAFAATIGMEENIESSVLLDAAKISFNKTIEKEKNDLYRHIIESGAFSFYYLAYRRGSEVERRIGQTFAMLCSHDGDSVFQELGEALYCWFLSKTEKMIKQG